MQLEIWADRHQVPVGQGGFHFGHIGTTADIFRYVYDCGSAHKSALLREVNGTNKGVPIELLALSHLDEDHVNGVDLLLRRHPTDTVILPYLHSWERLALVADLCARGLYSEEKMRLISRTEAWFGDRGVRRVAYVLPPDEDGAGGTLPSQLDDVPRRGRADLEQQGDLQLSGLRPITSRHRERFPGLPPAGPGASVVSPGQKLQVVSRSAGVSCWELIPFNHRVKMGLTAFGRAAARVLRLPAAPVPDAPGFFDALKKALHDPVVRRKLGDAYRHAVSRRNYSSMTLYSGPDRASLPNVRASVGDGEVYSRGSWLGTGDAVLSAARARELGRYYADQLAEILTFVLPHHGARRNFVARALPKSFAPKHWVAAYGTQNRYGHPSKSLMRAAKRRGNPVRVNEDPSTKFVENLAASRF